MSAVLPGLWNRPTRAWLKHRHYWLRKVHPFGPTTPYALATPGFYGPLGGVSSFTRADATTCATQNNNGTFQTVLANVLRDLNWVKGTRTILLEESRQNVVINNTILTAVSWSMSNMTGAMNAVGPDGVTNSAGTLTATGGTPIINRLTGVSVPAASPAAQFWLVKRGNQPWCFVNDAGDSASHRVWFNFDTGVVGTQTNATGYLLPIGNGWFLLGMIYTAISTYNQRVGIQPARTDGNNNGASGDTLLVYEPQGEPNKAFPTSVIATAATMVTRALDALSLVGSPIIGTLFYHYYDLATQAWTDAVAAYAGSVAITPPVNRAYSHIAVVQGTRTAAQCKAIIGGTFP